MGADDWATLITAGGGGAMVTAVISALVKWLSNSAHRERIKNTSVDSEMNRRREAEEHVSILKRQLLENGIEPREREESK